MYLKFLPQGSIGILVLVHDGMESTLVAKTSIEETYVVNTTLVTSNDLEDNYVENTTLVFV